MRFKGSPPPMRGKVRLLYHRGEFFRITPAYAGKSKAGFRSYGKGKDHPRLCGEKSGSEIISYTDPGSPPPMRGKEGEKSDENPKEGITPAYAGKRNLNFNNVEVDGDHPRLCGEKILSKIMF